ncbi:MAG: UDP-N-acetylmuramate dehydrogenase [Rickettsiales bacterium]
MTPALPLVRGAYRFDANLAPTMWFQTGGPARALFRPADADDLAQFMREYDGDLPVLPLGLGSNTLVRDGGVNAVIVKLGKGFTQTERLGERRMYVGAGLPAAQAAKFAAAQGLSGAEFMIGIPGAIGGLVKMNAGAYGGDMAGIVEYADLIDGRGERIRLSVAELGYGYRHSALPSGSVCVGAALKLSPDDAESVDKTMGGYMEQRALSQPVKGRTGGSTFKNPPGDKAWRLIDAAGCRGLTRGGAQVSELHCNFLLNVNHAAASDIEELGEEVRAKVLAHSGTALEWEIIRIGEKREA